MSIFKDPYWQPVDVNGTPFPGGKLYFYEPGGVVARATYSNAALSVPNTNPVIADANGRFGPIYLQALDYKIVLTTAADVAVLTHDNMPSTKSETSTPIVAASSTATAALAATNSSSGAGVHAKNSVTGYALIVEGDTSSPTVAPLHIVPLDMDPGNLADGNLWIAGSKLRGTDGLSAYGYLTDNGAVIAATPNATNGLTTTGKTTGAGAHCIGGSTGYGLIAEADTTTPVRAALRIVPQDATPTGPNAVGDLCVVGGKLYICTVAGTPGTWTIVGTQS